MSLNTLETIRYEKNGEILNGVSSPNPVSSKERVVKLWAEILPNEDHSAVLHYLIVDENGVERTEEISVTALEDLIASLDATKVDIDAFRIDLGIKDLISNNTFNLTSSQIESISQKTTSIIEVTDNVTGRHRYFARTSYEPNGGIVTFCEVVDMGTKKTPSINEIEVSVGTSTAQYMEMGLQPRLSPHDLDNIAMINDLPSKAEVNENMMGVPDYANTITDIYPQPTSSETDGYFHSYITPANGYIILKVRSEVQIDWLLTEQNANNFLLKFSTSGFVAIRMVILPVSKGNKIQLKSYNNVFTNKGQIYSKFVYCKEIK